MSGANGRALLGPALTANYRPTVYGWSLSHLVSQTGFFTLAYVEHMDRDPQIQLGMRIIRGPIQTTKWKITADAQVAAWLDMTLKFIWKKHLRDILTMLKYGEACGEVLWTTEGNSIVLDSLKPIKPRDAKVLELRGKPTGIILTSSSGDGTNGVTIDQPGRFYWVVNDPDFGHLRGTSRYFGAFEPWMEKRGRHGAVDVRRLWYVKNAFRGPVMRHPNGVTEVGDGVYKSNQDIAREIVEKWETGGVAAIPSTIDPDSKQPLWSFEDPKPNGEIKDVRDYPKDLDREMLIGMGIPPEVVEASEVGSGYAGRAVPALVFYTSEDELVDNIIATIDEQVLRPGVKANFGDAKYTIEPESLAEKNAQQQPQPGNRGLQDLLGNLGGDDDQDDDGSQVGNQDREPVRLSTAPAGRGKSGSHLIDAIIEKGMGAGVAVTDEIRRRVIALAKKKYPGPSSTAKPDAS